MDRGVIKMSKKTIKCPDCGNEVELNDALNGGYTGCCEKCWNWFNITEMDEEEIDDYKEHKESAK